MSTTTARRRPGGLGPRAMLDRTGGAATSRLTNRPRPRTDPGGRGRTSARTDPCLGGASRPATANDTIPLACRPASAQETTGAGGLLSPMRTVPRRGCKSRARASELMRNDRVDRRLHESGRPSSPALPRRPGPPRGWPVLQTCIFGFQRPLRATALGASRGESSSTMSGSTTSPGARVVCWRPTTSLPEPRSQPTADELVRAQRSHERSVLDDLGVLPLPYLPPLLLRPRPVLEELRDATPSRGRRRRIERQASLELYRVRRRPKSPRCSSKRAVCVLQPEGRRSGSSHALLPRDDLVGTRSTWPKRRRPAGPRRRRTSSSAARIRRRRHRGRCRRSPLAPRAPRYWLSTWPP